MKNFRSGRFVQQAHYKSFQPNPINRAWMVDDMALLQLLGQADRELGGLDMYSEYIPNIDLFIRMHVLKEATQSSKTSGAECGAAFTLASNLNNGPSPCRVTPAVDHTQTCPQILWVSPLPLHHRACSRAGVLPGMAIEHRLGRS